MRGYAALLLAIAAPAAAQDAPPLLTPAESAAIASEVSGSAAKRTVQALSLDHRMRGSEGYAAAAQLIRDRLTAYGLDGIEILSLPADGKIFYGTQRSRPAWNACFAELWEERQQGGAGSTPSGSPPGPTSRSASPRTASTAAAEGELVDVGAGTSEADYRRQGRPRKARPGLVPAGRGGASRGHRHGAAGLVSWAQNQKTGWWGDDESLIRWGHLDTWEDPTFAFMVSPARAHAWQARLAKGEAIRLRAWSRQGGRPGAYLIPTAIIPGKDAAHEIVFSCHLDHPSPGANDNASGCAGILEVARSLQPADRRGQAAAAAADASASSGRARSSARSPCSTRGPNSPGGRWRRSIST